MWPEVSELASRHLVNLAVCQLGVILRRLMSWGGFPVNLAVRLAGRQASVGLVNLVGVWGLAFLSTWSPGASPCVDWLWRLASWRVASGVLIGRACAGRVLDRMGAMGGIVAIGWAADGFPRRQAGSGGMG